MMDTRNQVDDTPLRVFVFDSARCRSHLWFRVLSQHPRFEKVYHPYLLTVSMGPYRVYEFLKHSEERHHEITVTTAPLYVTETREDASAELMRRLDEIEKKVSLIATHSPISYLSYLASN